MKKKMTKRERELQDARDASIQALTVRPTKVDKKTSTSGLILLKNAKAVSDSDPKLMLEVQYKLLMELSKKYPKDEVLQSFVADANLLNIEARERL